MEPTRKTTLASLCAEAGSLEGLLELLGLRQRGSGVYADLLAQRFKRVERRLGLNRGEAPLDVSQFEPPKPDDKADRRQLSLL